MEALRQLYAGLGYAGVQSYIQSGNVIFNTPETDTHTLETTISEKIYETFGFKVSVLVITTDELADALKNNPYWLTERPGKDLFDFSIQSPR